MKARQQRSQPPEPAPVAPFVAPRPFHLYTPMTTTISSPEQIADMSANQEQKTFMLPADIMYIAAQFASQDSFKGMFKGILTGISIKPCVTTADSALTPIEICSTDGHRMFRCRIPVVEKAFFLDRHTVSYTHLTLPTKRIV